MKFFDWFYFLLLFNVNYVKLSYLYRDTVKYTRAKIQKAGRQHREDLLNLIQDQENSIRECSRALALISKTKKELKSGVYDDSI